MQRRLFGSMPLRRLDQSGELLCQLGQHMLQQNYCRVKFHALIKNSLWHPICSQTCLMGHLPIFQKPSNLRKMFFYFFSFFFSQGDPHLHYMRLVDPKVQQQVQMVQTVVIPHAMQFTAHSIAHSSTLSTNLIKAYAPSNTSTVQAT